MYIANRVTREIYSTLDQINQIFRSFAFIQNKKKEEKIKREKKKCQILEKQRLEFHPITVNEIKRNNSTGGFGG